MDQRRTDTRTQLQAVALELFAERGYDSTSLREIAERLNITKAAVYYHFRSKDEILVSLITDFLDRLDDLSSWGETQPRNADTRIGMLRRYDDMLSGQTSELARLLREGRASLRDPQLEGLIRDRYRTLIELLTPPGDAVMGRLRARLALSSLQMGTTQDPEEAAIEPLKQRAAALTIATHLLTTPVDTSVD
jgi:AcrR family transcriptional regulator